VGLRHWLSSVVIHRVALRVDEPAADDHPAQINKWLAWSHKRRDAVRVIAQTRDLSPSPVTAQWASTYWGRVMMRDTSQALQQLSLLHRTITLHTVFGATPDTRERLLQIANELTGQKNKTLHSALGEIDVQIAKLRGEQRTWASIGMSPLNVSPDDIKAKLVERDRLLPCDHGG
jgi:hypothetical protein